jgi:hypothetical protein
MLKKERKKSTVVLFVGFILLAGLPLWAQEEYPKVEVFGGYSYANIDRILSFSRGRENGHGWGASVSGNFHKNFGVTADFAGHYGDLFRTRAFDSDISVSGRAHEFLFGPRVTLRRKSVTAFAHALFGAVRASVPSFTRSTPTGTFGFVGGSETAFAMGFGGGLDVNLGKHFAVRAAQVDYIPVHLSPGWLHNVRIQTGIVFKFGS